MDRRTNQRMAKSRVALITGDDRRRNILEAMRLVREDLLPRIHGQVMIKPNLVTTGNQLAATHVDAVRAILDFVVEVGPDEIVVAEGTADSGPTGNGWQNYGYCQLKEEYPVTLRDLNLEERWETITLLDGREQPVEAKICSAAVESDCRISAPVAKTHNFAICTLSMKNMMGAQAHSDRQKTHGHTKDFKAELLEIVRVIGKNIVRLNESLLPHIAVIDGFEGMEGNGPCGGDPVPLRAAIVSSDPVAADAVAAKVMGFEPLEVGSIYYANECGMGIGDLARIEVLGNEIQEVAQNFKPHEDYETQRQWRVQDGKVDAQKRKDPPPMGVRRGVTSSV